MRLGTLALVWIAFLLAANLPLHAAESDAPPSGNPRILQAVAVWQEYHRALLEGNEQEARSCWTEAAQRSPTFDSNWRFDQGVAIARQDSMQIAEAQDCSTYVALRVTSTAVAGFRMETDRGTDMVRRRWILEPLLANPIEVLTSGWHERTTRHFVLHCANGGSAHRGAGTKD